ncbi:hypothetical protein HR11_06250 [Porphyromonas macacae]|uniref:alpha-ribazole phosphatase family protein n=1 Tax=Porphyromonas macacae TaxID=28115 RepID=UPI00052DA468|nr:alpha-ribazole phosphatase family protein [Porphyromonas macacae]KGN99805.1 hypothetical protein HR11_06250 [Porphyromonas macacae]
MEVFLVRHTTPLVPQGICYGQTDLDVTDTFETEARIVKEQLRGFTFSEVYSSPLKRCVKLAGYCGYVNPKLDRRLMEKNFGDWEMTAWDDIKGREAEMWYANWVEQAPPKGESLIQQYERMKEFFDDLKQLYPISSSPVLIFTHGGIQTLAGVYAGLYPLKECFEHTFPYGSIVKLSL